MSSNIFFRVDAFSRIGSGHLIRCKNLARSLRALGASVFFISRSDPDSLTSFFLNGEFILYELPPLPADRNNYNFIKDNYSTWLGCSETQDAKDTVELLSSKCNTTIDCIIVDHYSLGRDWEYFVHHLANFTDKILYFLI